MEIAFAIIVLIAAIFALGGVASLAVGRLLVLSLFYATGMKYPPYLRWSDLLERQLKDVKRGFPVLLIAMAFIRIFGLPLPPANYFVAGAGIFGGIFILYDVARLTFAKRLIT